MKGIGIKQVAMNCALGRNLKQIAAGLFSGRTVGMEPDNQWLFQGGITRVGRVHIENQDLNPEFDCRVNHLLADLANQLDPALSHLVADVGPSRVGVVIGTSTSGVDEFERALAQYDETSIWPKEYHITDQRMGNVSESLARYCGITGPVMSVSTACSSGAKAILAGKRWLEQGLCDVVLAGGVDVLCHLTLNGFNALGALSSQLSLPFSVNRQGINIGEAGALFVLTKEPCEVMVMGGGESSDAHHISAPDPTGKGAKTAMQQALDDAGLQANDIEYVNLHGTGTPQNDAMEALVMDQLFAGGVSCSSSKAMTGHTLGAAGALELGLCWLSMTAWNTTGSHIPHVYDGEYDPDIKRINLAAIDNNLGKPQYVMSNSYAFGGSNASLILGRHHG